MSSHRSLFTTLAFVAGVLLTLGFKDFYPDLERRFRRRRQGISASQSDAVPGVQLHIKTLSSDTQQIKYEIKDGIDGAIGNTPLIRIRSLSEKTGCDILAKCEVSLADHSYNAIGVSSNIMLSLSS